jgi:hypothetical protein
MEENNRSKLRENNIKEYRKKLNLAAMTIFGTVVFDNSVQIVK